VAALLTLLTGLLAGSLLLLAGLLTAALLLAWLLIGVLALLTRILVWIVLASPLLVTEGQRPESLLVAKELRFLCASFDAQTEYSGTFAAQLDVDDDPNPQPAQLPLAVPAVRKWDDATIRLPEPSTC
jgi:hypothetical protein